MQKSRKQSKLPPLKLPLLKQRWLKERKKMANWNANWNANQKNYERFEFFFLKKIIMKKQIFFFFKKKKIINNLIFRFNVVWMLLDKFHLAALLRKCHSIVTSWFVLFVAIAKRTLSSPSAITFFVDSASKQTLRLVIESVLVVASNSATPTFKHSTCNIPNKNNKNNGKKERETTLEMSQSNF